MPGNGARGGPLSYRFPLAARLLATACSLGLGWYAWFVSQQDGLTFSTRRSGLVTLFGHQLDQYALWLLVGATLPLAVWFRSSRALAWALFAWFCTLMALLYLWVLGPSLG